MALLRCAIWYWVVILQPLYIYDVYVSVVVCRVACLVIDEAHKGRGKYSYVSVVNTIHQDNPFFRILALSATPGKDAKHMQEVS